MDGLDEAVVLVKHIKKGQNGCRGQSTRGSQIKLKFTNYFYQLQSGICVFFQ